MPNLFDDKLLMRAKDIILIATAIVGLTLGTARVIEKPFQLETEMKGMRACMETHQKKFEPMIELHQTELALQRQTDKQILSILRKIEKKLGI